MPWDRPRITLLEGTAGRNSCDPARQAGGFCVSLFRLNVHIDSPLFQGVIATAWEKIHSPGLKEEKLVWYEQVRIPNCKSEEQRVMAMKKIAISLPEPVLERVDRLAASRGESRSHLIATVLDRVARAKRDRDVTTQIDVLLADRTLAAEQKATADEFLQMSPWPRGKW